MSIMYQYVLAVPLERADVGRAITEAAKVIGKLKKYDEKNGDIEIIIKEKQKWLANSSKFHFSLAHTQAGVTAVMAFCRDEDFAKLPDILWAKLISEMLNRYDIALEVRPDEIPYIVRSYSVDNNVTQITSTTMQGAAVRRAILGGAIFGGAGAISSMHRARTESGTEKSELSDNGVFIAEYSNGRIAVLNVQRGTKQFNELMEKLVK